MDGFHQPLYKRMREQRAYTCPIRTALDSRIKVVAGLGDLMLRKGVKAPLRGKNLSQHVCF